MHSHQRCQRASALARRARSLYPICMQLFFVLRMTFATSSFPLVLLAFSAFAEEKFSFEKTPGKLPKDVVPRHYNIDLRPDMETATTEGSQTVDIEVIRPITEIVLNALDLAILRAEILGVQAQPASLQFNQHEQTVTLKLARPLPAGNHQLHLDFKGKISEKSE